MLGEDKTNMIHLPLWRSCNSPGKARDSKEQATPWKLADETTCKSY